MLVEVNATAITIELNLDNPIYIIELHKNKSGRDPQVYNA